MESDEHYGEKESGGRGKELWRCNIKRGKSGNCFTKNVKFEGRYECEGDIHMPSIRGIRHRE